MFYSLPFSPAFLVFLFPAHLRQRQKTASLPKTRMKTKQASKQKKGTSILVLAPEANMCLWHSCFASMLSATALYMEQMYLCTKCILFHNACVSIYFFPICVVNFIYIGHREDSAKSSLPLLSLGTRTLSWHASLVTHEQRPYVNPALAREEGNPSPLLTSMPFQIRFSPRRRRSRLA